MEAQKIDPLLQGQTWSGRPLFLNIFCLIFQFIFSLSPIRYSPPSLRPVPEYKEQEIDGISWHANNAQILQKKFRHLQKKNIFSQKCSPLKKKGLASQKARYLFR